MPAPRNPYDRRHLRNLALYRQKVSLIFNVAASEAAMIGTSIDAFDPSRPFSFADYPRAAYMMNELVRDFARDLDVQIIDGVEHEWNLANGKDDALVKSVFGDNLTPDMERRYFTTNEPAMDAFVKRKEGGMDLSERVWKYSNEFKSEIEMGIDIGLRDGLDARAMARDLQQYLRHPDMLFRRVRDEHGNLHLSQRAAAFHPGQGVYRSSYRNALRLTVTECNMAYRTADYLRWQQMDFVVGIEIELSNNHTCLDRNGVPQPFTDICDELKGKYPKEFKFVGWHPFCRCHATPILKTDEELDKELEAALLDEPEPDTTHSDNEVTDVPDGFKQWLDANAERIENAKSMPYFIRDNFKDGDPSKGLRWMDDAIQPTEKMVEHYETIGDVEKKLNDVGRDWIAGVEDGRFNISHSPVSNSPVAGETDGLGNLYISGKESLIDTFNKIAQGEIDKITEKEARNLETLWHEITHCRNIHFRAENELSVMAREYMETANEWVSRKTFGDFMERLGSSKIPHPELLVDDPLNGYNAWAKGYQNFIESFGLNESKVLESLKYHLFNDEYKTMKKGLFMALEDGGLTTIDGRKLSLRQKTMLLDMIKRGFNKSWADSTAAEFGIKILR